VSGSVTEMATGGSDAPVMKLVQPSLAELAEYAGIAVFTWDSVRDDGLLIRVRTDRPPHRRALASGRWLAAVEAVDLEGTAAWIERARHGETGQVRVTARSKMAPILLSTSPISPPTPTCRRASSRSSLRTCCASPVPRRRATKARPTTATPWRSIPRFHGWPDADGRRTEVGPRWAHHLRPAARTDYTKGWIQVLHPDDRDSVIAEWRRCVRDGTPLDIEYRMRTASGVRQWMRARARPSLGPLEKAASGTAPSKTSMTAT